MELSKFAFGLAAIWHTMAVVYFLGLPFRMLGSHARERPVSPVAVDMMQFLGAINFAILMACGLGMVGSPDVIEGMLVVVGVANLSQFLKDLHAHASGRWRRRLAIITTIDAFFAFTCLGLALEHFVLWSNFI